MDNIDNHIINEDKIGATFQQVEKDKEYIQSLQAISKSDLKELLENEKKKKLNKRSLYSFISVAISIAAVFAIIYSLDLFKDRTGENLYQSYFESPTYDLLISRGYSDASEISQKTQKIIAEFYILYEKKQYADALQLALPIIQADELKNYYELLFYVSICQLEENKVSDARKNLEQLSLLGDLFPYFQSVDWYLALTYLKLNQMDKSQKLLEDIKEKGQYYSDKATELLTYLK